ncbi:thiol-disulfide oxidoreductase DCC family protein [Algimonas arctica]|uniref:thiol-disulfide oxidoreductase DCC family protein n=1 Tax=Algimonas arctica TaxID=1479486 RepID=UPI001679B622
MSTPGRFSVFYDNTCPMCRSEINFYRNKSGADAINWFNVSKPSNVPRDLTCEQAMARFHVRTIDGNIIDGGMAFVALWCQLPSFNWLGKIFSLPGIRWVVDRAYGWFLPVRSHLQKFFRKAI